MAGVSLSLPMIRVIPCKCADEPYIAKKVDRLCTRCEHSIMLCSLVVTHVMDVQTELL